ncbi:unnamed protein product [Paramecium primaurelia]|uniref:Uncharacterized protein n=1 Tax=Paramecium primaurelia TaxID=5886 RepID=A0A8S1QCU1_PARPR|nr:unnamed protein product [Paramecium primaurelia]
MQNNNPQSRNSNRFPIIAPPHKQQIEQEYSSALILLPIQKEESDNFLKQKIVELLLQIKNFSRKILDFSFEEKLKQLKDFIKLLDKCTENDQSIDWEQLKNHLLLLKEQYLNRENNFREHLKIIFSFNNIDNTDLVKFLRLISTKQFEISYQECQSLLFLQQELNTLEIFKSVLKPRVEQYKEIIYYEKTDSPIVKYTKNQVQNPYSMTKNDLHSFIGLLNKYYKFEAIPKTQEKYVQYMIWTPDINYNNLQYSKVLILILEIPLETNQCTYALLNIIQQQNQRVCKSTSIGKMRSQLHQLSQQIGCTTFTPTLVGEFKLETVIQELFKIVAPKINMQNLIQLLQENDYLLREDKNKSIGYEGNYILDAFEIERLGFLLE